eukprot:8546240-Alexandrium_andersonii.AAC.1
MMYLAEVRGALIRVQIRATQCQCSSCRFFCTSGAFSIWTPYVDALPRRRRVGSQAMRWLMAN